VIISRTPYRISLFGGGTDYPDWYRSHGGAVLAGTIDKYCYLTCRHLPPYFEHRLRVVYSKIEAVQSYEEVQHPVVRGVLEYLNVRKGVEIHHDGDLPGQSGMGSSSSFTVGLLNALYALRGHMPTRKQLADESIYIERELMKETVGCQDQILAAYGGFNLVSFTQRDEFTVRPVTITSERLEELSSHLMLFYTGTKRVASKIAETYVRNMDDNRRQLRIMRDMVEEALSIISGSGSMIAIGSLLHEAWTAKKSLGSGISTPQVDHIYEAARAAGALGGKLLGAGGGGFMCFFAEPHMQYRIKAALGELIYVPFSFQPAGSEIIFYEPDSSPAHVSMLPPPMPGEP
jgi:D-glycero-alpha-D-manno-heptose-7-phosphate kinase